MARISEAQKQKLEAYAEEIGLRADIAYVLRNSPTASHLDAAKEACDHVSKLTSTYYHVKNIAPRNPTRHRGSFKKLLDEVEDKELLISEWRSLSPLNSQTKEVKSLALDEARSILSAAGIGKKTIAKITPLFFDELQDEDNLPTEILPIPKFLQK